MAEITLESICGPDGPERSKYARDLGKTTKRAKELFFFGDGDGKPVRSLTRLAEKSGASARTLEKYVDAWQLESEELSRGNAGKRGLVASVTDGDLTWQKNKVLLLKSQCDKLESTLENLTPGSDLYRDTLKLLSATLSKWEESSGFSAMAATQAVLAKEVAKASIRGSNRGEVQPRQASGFTFDLEPAALPE